MTYTTYSICDEVAVTLEKALFLAHHTPGTPFTELPPVAKKNITDPDPPALVEFKTVIIGNFWNGEYLVRHFGPRVSEYRMRLVKKFI